MDKSMSAALMADFSAEAVGHKPATWCRNCSDVVRQRKGKACGDHKVIFCRNCKTNVTDAHTCLDFVGHADVRARLCDVDPEWSWEPFEFPGTGSLILRDGDPVGLWIKLTVGGVSKPGYGSVDKGKSEAMKELIGDALRNAGLSFGIAWKLWAKGERNGGESEHGASTPQGESRQSTAPRNGSNGNGRVSRPAAPAQPPAAASGEPDPDAQPYADEAYEARTLAALRDVNTRAREARKLAALVRNPSGGGVGGLGQYIGWCKKQLEEVDAALSALQQAAGDMPATGLDAHVRKVTGAGIEDATAAQLREAAKALAQVAA